MKRKGRGSEIQRQKVINSIKTWINDRLKGYIEPQRAGTSKGDAIGYSKKKLLASALLAVYPKIQLREIAKASEVKPEVLSVWRTQDDFKAKEAEFAKHLGVDLAAMVVGCAVEDFIRTKKTSIKIDNSPEGKERLKKRVAAKRGVPVENVTLLPHPSYTLIGDKAFVLRSEMHEFENEINQEYPARGKYMEGKRLVEIDDRPTRWTSQYADFTLDYIQDEVVPLAAWLNEVGSNAFLNFVKDYLALPRIASVLMFLRKESFFWEDYDQARIREWNSQPLMKELTKNSLLTAIDMLADPGFREEMGSDEVQKLADRLKKEVVEVIDILA